MQASATGAAITKICCLTVNQLIMFNKTLLIHFQKLIEFSHNLIYKSKY